MLSFTIIPFLLLVYFIHHVSAKEIKEEEDEIGYIQSVLSNSDDPVVSIKSKYQHIEMYNSEHFGKIFVLDEALQLTEKDAPHYNEMLAHVPIMEYLKTHDVKDTKDTMLKVLVVGGGDGYVVNELVKYSKIGVIDHVELDEEVINVSKKHLPWGIAWNDPRVNLIIEDGAKFIKEQAESGIQDSSDPMWEEEDGSITTLPSSVLYEKSHFDNLYKLLEPKSGVFMMQAETYNIPSNIQSIKKWRQLLLDVGFATARYGTIAIPTYPTGQIGFFAAHVGTTDSKECKSDNNVCDDKSKSFLEMNWSHAADLYSQIANTLQYYHPGVHMIYRFGYTDISMTKTLYIDVRDKICFGIVNKEISVKTLTML